MALDNISNDIVLTYREYGVCKKILLLHNDIIFNTGEASAAIYQLEGMTDELMQEVNALVDDGAHAAVRERCELIKQHCKVKFVGFPIAKKAKCVAFGENLEMLNCRLKVVIQRILYNRFFDGYAEKDITKVVERIIAENPCQINFPEKKYPYMIKAFLYAAYCGLTASTVWDGISNVNGGFITVCSNGDVVAQYALESDAFKTYLYNNCYFDDPSTAQEHGYYGFVYKENDEYFFRLNFQIRYH